MQLRHLLVAVSGLAVAGFLGATAASAQTVTTSVNLTKDYNEDVDVHLDNNIDIDIAKDIDVSKDLDYNGVVNITGNVNVSEAAMSFVDNKQIVDDNFVNVRGSDFTLNNVALIDGTVLGSASGNIGVNVAVGDNLLQENAAVLSAIGTTTAAGSADAETFSVQKSINNQFDDELEDSEVFNNTQLIGNVLELASGNIGVNVSTGAYNLQKNVLALASVTGVATLSEATAAVLQESTFNETFHNDTSNEVKLQDAVANAVTGNIGINLSAGTNNLQQNTLAISAVTP